MKTHLPIEIEAGRYLQGKYASPPAARYGLFALLKPPMRKPLIVMASDGEDWEGLGLPLPQWEHLSVSCQGRCPTWEEMCWVKSLFFDPEELVIQFHPPQSKYVNCHPHTLHLWKPVGVEIPLPPVECV
jgi:hypothetical protein